MNKSKIAQPRLSHQGLLVLKVFLEHSAKELCGKEVMDVTSLPSGTIYPILLRFETYGLLNSKWELGNASKIGRPRKRLYHLTGKGMVIAREALFNLSQPFSNLVPESV